ncbi:MAG TPA: SusC/RagA family TonB-linked outer membrane protein, partial [Segetibacter sp.]
MLRLNLLPLIFGTFLCSLVSAQTRISGRVIDAKTNAPVSGATVSVKNNTNISTATADDGSFSLNAPANARLIVSFVGYKPMEIAASAASSQIKLSPGEATLNEVVVVGYGTSLRRDITGSVAKVSARDINNTPVTSFESALQGRASGVFVQQQNGKVGQGINIRIRGASSISAGNEPLYVVDGVPLITENLSSSGAPTNALADININDIESVEILKDASSAAIYGSRASNGVVIITTKKGKAGASKIEFSYFTGRQTPTRKREFLNAQQYVEFFEQAAVGRGKVDYANNPSDFTDVQEAIDTRMTAVHDRFTRYSAGTDDWKTGKINNNWQDQAFQRAPISQYDISLSGGTDKTKIYASGQYLDQKGVLIKNAYKRYSGRLNMDHQIKDWLSVGMNMNFARSE